MLTTNEAHKNRVKNQYEKVVKSRVFSEGGLVFLWDEDKVPLRAGKFNSMWLGPYIVSKVFKRGSCKLTEYDRNKFP